MLIHGSCHCGNIAFDLAWEPDPVQIPARACTCSFCRKHGGVWTSHPAGSLRVTVRNAGRVSHYAFGTRTAVFHVCSDCGVAPVVTCTIDDRLYAVVSVNAMQDVDPALFRHAAATFESETVEARLARRKRNWIADVRLEGTGG